VPLRLRSSPTLAHPLVGDASQLPHAEPRRRSPAQLPRPVLSSLPCKSCFRRATAPPRSSRNGFAPSLSPSSPWLASSFLLHGELLPAASIHVRHRAGHGGGQIHACSSGDGRHGAVHQGPTLVSADAKQACSAGA
uniref:Uncharacterized protein n=1 Tax=Triticum urartu TaxID=4572 RepID=A0A8R7R126_TRIUA